MSEGFQREQEGVRVDFVRGSGALKAQGEGL